LVLDAKSRYSGTLQRSCRDRCKEFFKAETVTFSTYIREYGSWIVVSCCKLLKKVRYENKRLTF